MSLKPLRQWLCDTCHQVISTPKHGWVEWLVDADGKCKGFRIVHHAMYSPRQPEGDCYYGDKQIGAGKRVQNHHLTEFVNEGTMLRLLWFIDPQPFSQPEYRGPMVSDLREWVEFVRRLTIPYYEEARQYMSRAYADGRFEGVGEFLMYESAILRDVISRYGGEG